MLRASIVSTALALIAATAQAGDASIAVKGWGDLVLPLPAGWHAAARTGGGTLTLTAATGKAFRIEVSPLRAADGFMPDASKASLRSIVSLEAQTTLPHAVEKALPVRELPPGRVYGSYFSATDRAPAPGEFKYMTQGVIAVQGLPVVFTILSDGDRRTSDEPALRMLQGAHKR